MKSPMKAAWKAPEYPADPDLYGVPREPADDERFLHGLPARRVTAAEIIREVAAGYGITESDILSHRRNPVYSMARVICAHRLHEQFPTWSYVRIGRAMNRHHASIMFLLGKLDHKPVFLEQARAAA